MFKQWTALPLFEDEYDTFAARVLHYTLLVLICISLSFVFFASSPSQLILIPVVVAVFGGSYVLLHRGRFRLAGLIFVIGLWLVITVASFEINGLRNASISGYTIVIIFSAVLFPKREVIIFTVISICSVVILAVGEIQGVLPFHTTPLYWPDRLFQQIALFGTAGILLTAASRRIRATSVRIRNHEKMLLERNQALEMEIAERKRTEANLRLSEEKYRVLFENIPAMAAVYGQDGEIVLLNKATADLLGSTQEALLGRNLRDVLTPEDAEGAIRVQAQVIEDGKHSLTEGKIKIPGRSEFYYFRHIMPLPKAITGEVSQVLVLTVDVTAKYEAEQRERDLELAREKNALLTEFFSTLSHDLKTPLTVIKTGLYLLERAKSPEQRQEKIVQIEEQVTLMDEYIQDMLTISRLEHMPTLTLQDVNLNALIDKVVDLLRARLEGKQIQFQFIGQPDLPSIRGDEDQLRRMLINLIENAINYTPAGGEVNIKTIYQDGRVVLKVIDSGIGIEASAIPHIFERFFRASNATAFERRGTGLGLAIVKKIVDGHVATIAVESQIGEGTTFSVQFETKPVA